MWIYEHQDWPEFTWDDSKLAFKLADIRYRQGRLLGRMESLGFELKREASLNILTNDVIKTSAIEGEYLDTKEVRSSIARRLGINVAGFVRASRDVEGIVEMMLDATRQFAKPLTRERLFDWHASLFPDAHTGWFRLRIGEWRDDSAGPMRIASGPVGREKIHFEAPNADRLEQEMADFLYWFERKDDVDPVFRAAVAHFWFVTIHPFEDGNGRIGRAISDMALARADGTPERFYSLSSQIQSEQKYYYRQLERQSRSTLDITGWLEWFLDCLGRAITFAEDSFANVLFKAQLWKRIDQHSINARQRLIINRMLEDHFKGHMNTSKYAKLAKCSKDTALRDIQGLKAQGIFIQNSGGGRSTSYRLTDDTASVCFE